MFNGIDSRRKIQFGDYADAADKSPASRGDGSLDRRRVVRRAVALRAIRSHVDPRPRPGYRLTPQDAQRRRRETSGAKIGRRQRSGDVCISRYGQISAQRQPKRRNIIAHSCGRRIGGKNRIRKSLRPIYLWRGNLN